MFLKKKPEYPSLPEPPTPSEILEDLSKAGPDDIVFTADINGLDLETSGQGFPVLAGRFQVTSLFPQNSLLQHV
jgi:hypothetical protein